MISTAKRSSGSQPAASCSAAALERSGFFEQGFRAPVEHLPVGGQMGLAADRLRIFSRSERFDFLHGIGHGGLALVQCGRRLGIAAGIHDSQQRAPLLERNTRDVGHDLSIK